MYKVHLNTKDIEHCQGVTTKLHLFSYCLKTVAVPKVFNEMSSWGPGNYGLKTQIPNENGYFSVLCSAFKKHRLATKKLI